MDVSAVLSLLVSLLTLTSLTCKASTKCAKPKVVINELLPLSIYMKIYYDNLKHRPQPALLGNLHLSNFTTQNPKITQGLSTSMQSSELTSASTQAPTEKTKEEIDQLNTAIKCGTVAIDDPQAVIGGNNAPEKSYPWQAYIRNDRSFCGGTLISSQWVLTAAHCINNTQIILLGAKDIANYSLHGLTFSSFKTIKHENYNKFNNDIALIKLDTTVLFNDYIRPACLPEKGAIIQAKSCSLTGWGYTSFEPRVIPHILQEVQVDIIDNTDCAEGWRLVGRTITEEHLCTAAATGAPKGTCSGDSGGPLNCFEGSSFYIAGVSVRTEYKCQKVLIPDLYERVSFYREWIDRTMANN